MKVPAKIYRLTSFMYLCFVAFAIYCTGCAMAIIFNSDLKEAEKEEREKITGSRNFRRGNILSSDGKPLAAYYPEYTLFTDFGVRIGKSFTIDRQKVTEGTKGTNPVRLDTFRLNIYSTLAESLAKTAGGNASSYYKDLYNYRLKAEDAKKSGKAENRQWFTENILKHRISVFQRDEIIENPYLKKRGRNTTGIYARETGMRVYPFGEDFAHSTIGVIGERMASGIEKMYNTELTGGDDVLTTIDTRMQDICETVLRDKIASDKRFVGGTIVLMEVSTGNIKAMANIGIYYKEECGDLHDTYNNATRAAIEPGSTFKAVSLMLALETGKISLSDRFNTKVWRNGKSIEENRLDTFLSVSRIIEHSSNTGAGNMVDKAFNGNTDKFISAIKALKITDGIENMDGARPSINPNNNRESIMNISFGYQIKMAPIHILSFYNAIANGGVMVKPRLVRGLKRRTGELEIFKPEIINRSICSGNTLDSVRLALSRVVGRGSARRIAGSPYGIVGKTGTAKIWLENVRGYETADGLGRDLSSFCGYFPQKNPKYSCIVTLYTKLLSKPEMEDFYAGSTAVPLFRKVSDKVYALHFNRTFSPAAPARIPTVKNTDSENLAVISKKLNLPLSPDGDSNTWFRVDTTGQKLQLSEIPLKRGTVPDVTGMGLRDALFLLENMGFKVSYSGIGTVVKQSPEKGVPYSSDQKIHLTLD